MINGFNLTQVWVDEYWTDMYSISEKIRIINNFIGNPYKYNHYYKGDIILRLINEGLLRGHALHVKDKTLHGYIGVTELGKTWLEFQKL